MKIPSQLRLVLAVCAGILLGSAVNMGLILNSSSVIPPPEGADLTTAEGLKASMHLFQPKHFIMPFVAHALGTFLGAFVAVSLSGSRPIAAAMAVGLVFLVGGIINVVMLPSPLWFTLTDLLLAYLPMAWLGTQLANRIFRAGTPNT